MTFDKTFEKFVCWRSELVQRVMNVEAIQTEPHIFLATHHPIAMYQEELTEASTRLIYNEEKFIRDFLSPKDFVFVPVIGDSGTGKSHLIRWLEANIKSTERRKILLISKVNTNLKNIIEKILNIEGMEGEKFDKYRQRLNSTTSTLTEVKAREHLLANIAIEVGPNGQHSNAKLFDSDLQDYLIKELPSLLRDPFFSKHWLREDGIIHRLVTHTLGTKNTLEGFDEPLQFSIGDLPTRNEDINILDVKRQAGKQAYDCYEFLYGNEEIEKATVEWLNCHRNEAITQVLSLGREDLQRLMREVRETLAEKGIELVLLIEDFAKLQGIDREVLEAVLTRPQQLGSKPLCAIRTALACTEGYFNSYVLETVRQRVTFSVNLNIGIVGNQSLITEAGIQHFVARYLNAVRLEDEEILNWANSHKEKDYKRIPPVSACERCEHRQACHTGFGQVNGIGLYPFTPQALKQMLLRVNPGNFKPRFLIGKVLKYTLENSVTDIQQGCFPSVLLQEHFGKKRLSAIDQDRIRAKHPLSADRLEVLIELWTDSDELVLPTEVYTAFNLPPLEVTVQQTQPKKADPRTKETSANYNIEQELPPKQRDEILEKLSEQLEEINTWNNRGILHQDIEKIIREFVYPAVVRRIEWDTEMLLKGSFAGSGKNLFQQRNVIVHSSKVTRREKYLSGIILSLPLNPDDEKDFRDTAIAFQGILQYSHYKHWKFPDGDRYFRAYAKQLERWSQYVIEEIRHRPRESGERWNPVPAAVELLAIAARMSGHSTSYPKYITNALFLDLKDKDEASRSKTWQELFNVFQDNRKKLLEIVESRIACTKGSNTTFQIIDAVQIIDPLREVCKDWQPKCEIPNDLRQEYEVIQRVRNKVNGLLVKAIEEECDRQLGVYQRLVAEFGEDIKKKDVIDAVKQAMDKAREAGIFGLKNAENLISVIDQFDQTSFDSYIETMKQVKAEIKKNGNNSSKLLQYLSKNHQKAMKDASGFIKETNSFLDTSIARAQNDIYHLKSAEGGTVESSLQAIESGLAELHSLLTEIKG